MLRIRCFFLLALSAIVVSCVAAPVDTTPTLADATQPVGLATPTLESRTLNICAGSAPANLYLYDVPSYSKSAILEAIYDGPIDKRNFTYSPTILERLPSLDEGVLITPVQVSEGARVINDSGEQTQLVPGTVIRPANCRSSECAMTYTGGTIEMDRMSVTFQIQAGIYWSDGTPLTASDSVFSYIIAVDPETPYGVGGLVSRSVETITRTMGYSALDDRTVQWTGLPGFLDQNYQANFFIPLPKHQLDQYSARELLENQESLYMPLGWGAYRITEWQPEQIVAWRNPYYFHAAEGLAYFDRLVFRFVGQDVALNLEALQSGTCDVMLADALPYGQLQPMFTLASEGTIKVYPQGNPDDFLWEQVAFGINPTADYDRPDFFNDPRMRHAIAYCVDRQNLANSIYGGHGMVMDTYLPPEHPLSAQAAITHYSFDPAAGMALLEEMGWRDEDGDGTREANGVSGIPDGEPLRLNLYTTDHALRTEVSTWIKAFLSACSVDAVVISIPSRELLVKSQDGPVYGRFFDLAEFGLPLGMLPACGLFQASEIPSAGNVWSGRNVSGYENSVFDTACLAAGDALPGTEAYLYNQTEALRIFSEDLPVLPLFPHLAFSASRIDLVGLIPDLSQGNELWNIESFQIVP